MFHSVDHPIALIYFRKDKRIPRMECWNAEAMWKQRGFAFFGAEQKGNPSKPRLPISCSHGVNNYALMKFIPLFPPFREKKKQNKKTDSNFPIQLRDEVCGMVYRR